MTELTGSIPKPMLEVAGKTLLEYKFDALPEEVDEIIIIVGYLGSVIQKHFGGAYGSRKISYIEQKTLDGTAGALWCAQPVLKDKFLVMMGDDIYAPEDIAECINAAGEGWTLLVQQVAQIRMAGNVIIDTDGTILDIVENADSFEPGVACTNLFALDTRIFTAEKVPKSAGSTEFGLPQTAIEAARIMSIPFKAVYSTTWIQVTAPADLTKAERLLKETTSPTAK